MADEITRVRPTAGGELTATFQLVKQASASETNFIFINDSRVPYEVAITDSADAPDASYRHKVIWPRQERQFNGNQNHRYWVRLPDVDAGEQPRPSGCGVTDMEINLGAIIMGCIGRAGHGESVAPVLRQRLPHQAGRTRTSASATSRSPCHGTTCRRNPSTRSWPR